MSKYITLFLFFAIVSVAFSAPRARVNVQRQENNIKWWTDAKGEVYTSKAFDANVGKDKFVVIQFCATFSKECEALMPEWNKLAEIYRGANPKRDDVIVARIDGWTFNSLSQTYSVKRFPTIRFFNKNDPASSDEFAGDMNADKISEWVEGLIALKTGGKPAEEKKEEKKPEEPKKEEAKKEETKPEEPKKEEAKKEETKPVEEDLKKEFKLVLNTTLLQAQFDEVQKQLNTLKESLERHINDNFKKVESLSQSFEGHKGEVKNLQDNLRTHGDKISQVNTYLGSLKEDLKSSITKHTEDHVDHIKEGLQQVKNKLYEKKVEVSEGPGFLHNLIWMVIGGAIGGAAVFFMAGGNKKRRSMLD